MIAAMTTAAIVARIVEGLQAQGYAIVPRALPAAAIRALRSRTLELDAAGAFAPARTGRGAAARGPHGGARGDRIAWLDDALPAPEEQPVRELVAALRAACNRMLYLGIAEHELHYAIYPPGAGYARHRDRFRDDDARVLSFVLYLNESWQPADGGALRLHLDAAEATRAGAVPAPDHAEGSRHLDVAPQGGTLVMFLSATLEHEVLPASRSRISLAGWLRRRAIG